VGNKAPVVVSARSPPSVARVMPWEFIQVRRPPSSVSDADSDADSDSDSVCRRCVVGVLQVDWTEPVDAPLLPEYVNCWDVDVVPGK
jgi:hypothetical protein